MPELAIPARPAAGLLDRLAEVQPVRYEGEVLEVVGTLVEAGVPGTAIGSVCSIEPSGGQARVRAEVVGFRGGRSLLMPFGDVVGITRGSRVRPVQAESTVPVGDALLGRVVGPLGEPIDGLGPLRATRRASLHASPPDPLQRARIREAIPLGVRAIDGLLTLGKGQRVGIMAGTGVGKSTLLGMIARNVDADVAVIALIGERGREVREFVEENLGAVGMARSVVVAVTGDASPVLRVRGALTATSIAEHFRAQGLDVLLMMDSVTRLAMAQREIGLATGEPPTARGYTPSVFALLPRVLERCGTQPGGGSITGIFTVLVEGDDFNDPVADAVRGILDGHIVLSRELAARNHFPAIDVLGSVSRVMRDVVDPRQVDDAHHVRELLSLARDVEELVSIGVYQRGADAERDRALDLMPALRSFLRQRSDAPSRAADTMVALAELAAAARSPALPSGGVRGAGTGLAPGDPALENRP